MFSRKYRFSSDEEVEEFAIWLVNQFFTEGNEPPEGMVLSTLMHYFDEVKE
jgi:hypothetical protein